MYLPYHTISLNSTGLAVRINLASQSHRRCISSLTGPAEQPLWSTNLTLQLPESEYTVANSAHRPLDPSMLACCYLERCALPDLPDVPPRWVMMSVTAVIISHYVWMWIPIINHWHRGNSTKSVLILDSVFWGTRYMGGKFITGPCPPVRLPCFRADSEQLRFTRYLDIQDTSIYTSIDKIPHYQDTLEDTSIYT